MTKLITLLSVFLFFIGSAGIAQKNTKENSKFMIRHTVIFKLKHPEGSKEEKSFLSAAQKLSSLPGVKNFECLRQVSNKNNFDFGLSMEFDTKQLYEAYSNHPDHLTFVQNIWLKEVTDFLEIDYEPLTAID